jgi:predicted Zn-dependent protease
LDCVDALVARAKVALHCDEDARTALALTQKAVALAPKDPMVAALCAWVLILGQRFHDVHALLDRGAHAFDEEFVRTYRGTELLFERDFPAAIVELTAACSDRPHALYARACLGQALLLAGQLTRAMAEFDAVRLSAYDPLSDGELDARFLAEAYALYARFRFGDSTDAHASLERLARLSQRQFVPSACFAWAEAGRKQYLQAFHYLRRSNENGEWLYAQSLVDPMLDDLRAHTQNPRHIDGGFAT